MKEKITLFIALSFVLFLTVYKTAAQGNGDEEFASEPANSTIIDSEFDQAEEEILEELETIAISPQDSRAQLYIDRDWAPDETIDEIAYKKLGGQYTGFWDNLKLVKKTENQSNDKVDLVQN